MFLMTNLLLFGLLHPMAPMREIWRFELLTVHTNLFFLNSSTGFPGNAGEGLLNLLGFLIWVLSHLCPSRGVGPEEIGNYIKLYDLSNLWTGSVYCACYKNGYLQVWVTVQQSVQGGKFMNMIQLRWMAINRQSVPGHFFLLTFSADTANSLHSFEVEIQFYTLAILGKSKNWGGVYRECSSN